MIESPTSNVVGGEWGDVMGVWGFNGKDFCGLTRRRGLIGVVLVGFCRDLRPGHSQVLCRVMGVGFFSSGCPERPSERRLTAY